MDLRAVARRPLAVVGNSGDLIAPFRRIGSPAFACKQWSPDITSGLLLNWPPLHCDHLFVWRPGNARATIFARRPATMPIELRIASNFPRFDATAPRRSRPAVDVFRKCVYLRSCNLVYGFTLLTRSHSLGLLLEVIPPELGLLLPPRCTRWWRQRSVKRRP